jgi:glutamate-1-semialdehyde 2,1-aminomutase
MKTITTIDRSKVKRLLEQEQTLFQQNHPRSFELYQRAKNSLLAGVPMHWMTRWPGGFPVFVSEAKGATFKDVDGHDYIDLCMGDTGAMTGHAPEAVKPVILEQLSKGGITTQVWTQVLAICTHRDRRKSFFVKTCKGCYQTSKSVGLQRLLSRHGRRSIR